jgi:hypothetical protein
MANPVSPTLSALAADPALPVLLTTEQAAVLLTCSPNTLASDRTRRRWCVPYLRVGRAIRYDRAAVLRWLAVRNPAKLAGG